MKEKEWIIEEDEINEKELNIKETQFTIGNGYVGVRGCLEELPKGSKPGTYIRGIYNKLPNQVSKIVNLPFPFYFRWNILGGKLKLTSHKRELNLKKALLVRESEYQDEGGNNYQYHSIRFVKIGKKTILGQQIAIVPQDQEKKVRCESTIYTEVKNEDGVQHFKIKEKGEIGKIKYWRMETLDEKYTIVYLNYSFYSIGRKKLFPTEEKIILPVKKGEILKFTSLTYIKHFKGKIRFNPLKQVVVNEFKSSINQGWSGLVSTHTKKWSSLWKKVDLPIKGDEGFQLALRFNLYHLLLCCYEDKGLTSIPARMLTGEGYNGHIFWDTEIFMLPFFIFNFPEVAKSLLLYRYKRLNEAKWRAKNNKYKGALFPWESTDTGEEETPSFAKDFNGSEIKIFTHKMEHHISADVGYALWNYYLTTGDEEFMKSCGYEMLVEVARFWASRVKYNRGKRRYEIKNVIGPDEFHINVDNNFYTNLMAKWILALGSKIYNKIPKKVSKNLKLTYKEIIKWKNISEKLKLYTSSSKVIEQFDGYFRLKDYPVLIRTKYGIPLLSTMKTEDFKKTKLIKQPDLMMGMILLEEMVKEGVVKRNYNYYKEKITHKSSLSPSIFSIAGMRCDDIEYAYNLLKFGAKIDLYNLYNNTEKGIHGAAVGGVWQGVIFGIMGVKVKENGLEINPKLPEEWEEVEVGFLWKKRKVGIKLKEENLEIRVHSKKKERIKIKIQNKEYTIPTSKKCKFLIRR